MSDEGRSWDDPDRPPTSHRPTDSVGTPPDPFAAPPDPFAAPSGSPRTWPTGIPYDPKSAPTRPIMFGPAALAGTAGPEIQRPTPRAPVAGVHRANGEVARTVGNHVRSGPDSPFGTRGHLAPPGPVAPSGYPAPPHRAGSHVAPPGHVTPNGRIAPTGPDRLAAPDRPGREGGRRPSHATASPGRAGGERGGGLAALAGRASWNLIDQMLSTLTNAVLSIVVAREVNKSSFGAFSSAILIFGVLIAVERSLAGQVLGIRYSGTQGRKAWSEVASRAQGTVAVLAVPAGLVVAAVGLVLGGELRWPLVAVGLTMPFLLLQDNVRAIFFAQSRADLAALNDGVWALIQFPIMGLLIATGRASTGSLILTWGGSAGLCVALALWQLRAFPRPSAAGGWVKAHRDLLAYMLPQTLINTGGINVAYLLIGRIVNLAATGAVNAARQLFNPLLVISQAVASFSTPEIARRVNLSARQRWMVALALSGVQAAASIVYLGVVLLVPTSLGRALFGDTWSGAHAVLVPVGLFSTVAGICMGPFLVMSAMGHAKRTFRVSMLSTVLSVSLMPVGAVWGGAPGAAWGLFAGQAIELPFWFLTLRSVVRLGPALAPDEDLESERVA